MFSYVYICISYVYIYIFIVSTCFDSFWYFLMPPPEVMVIVLTVVSYTLAPTRQAKSVQCQVFRDQGDWPACWRESRDVRFVQFQCMAVYGVHRKSLFQLFSCLWNKDSAVRRPSRTAKPWPKIPVGHPVDKLSSRSRPKSSSVWDIHRALQRCSKWPSLTASAGYLLKADESQLQVSQDSNKSGHCEDLTRTFRSGMWRSLWTLFRIVG